MADSTTYVVAERFTPKYVGPLVARATSNMSLAVEQVAPDGFELSRAGRRFHIAALAATGQAPVQSLPTTTAQWVLFNTDPSTGKAVIFDWLGVVNASGTEGSGALIMCAFMTLPVQSGLLSNVLIVNASNSTRGSVLSVKSNVTITAPAAPAWFPLSAGAPSTTALQGLLQTYDLRGRIVIPPGTGLAMNVISPTGTSPLFVPAACWTEVESDLE